MSINIQEIQSAYHPDYPHYPLRAYPAKHPQIKPDETWGRYIMPQMKSSYKWYGHLDYETDADELRRMADWIENEDIPYLLAEFDSDDVGLYGYSSRKPTKAEYEDQVSHIYTSFEKQRQRELSEYKRLKEKFE